MTDESMFAQALAKLSKDDQDRVQMDLALFGTAMIEHRADGTVRLLNFEEVLIADVVPQRHSGEL